MFQNPPQDHDEFPDARSPDSKTPRRVLAALFLFTFVLLTTLGAPNRASAAALVLGPFTVADKGQPVTELFA